KTFPNIFQKKKAGKNFFQENSAGKFLENIFSRFFPAEFFWNLFFPTFFQLQMPLWRSRRVVTYYLIMFPHMDNPRQIRTFVAGFPPAEIADRLRQVGRATDYYYKPHKPRQMIAG